MLSDIRPVTTVATFKVTRDPAEECLVVTSADGNGLSIRRLGKAVDPLTARPGPLFLTDLLIIHVDVDRRAGAPTTGLLER